MSRALLLASLVLAVTTACKRESSAGLPPAKEWSASNPAPEAVPPAADPSNPHAGVGTDPSNPHGGMGTDPSNPHAGVPGMSGGNGMPSAQPTAPRSLDKLPDGRYVLGSWAFKLPDGWAVKPVTSEMRAADITIAADAEIIVYYFGESGAGSVQDNVDRWLGQLTTADGKPAKDTAKIEAAKVAGQDATLITAVGKYDADSMMAGQAATHLPDAELMAAIINSPMGPFYFKGIGNRATMEANTAKWKGMLASFEIKH
jgi:hypothetical protein